MADIQIHAAWHYLVGSGGPFRRHYRFGNWAAATSRPVVMRRLLATVLVVAGFKMLLTPLSNRGTLPHLFTKLDCHPMKVLFDHHDLHWNPHGISRRIVMIETTLSSGGNLT